MKLVKQNNNWLDPFDFFDNFEKSLFSYPRRQDLTYSFSPDLDLVEEENEYKARLDLPGIRKEEIDLSVTNDVLTIKGERKHEKEAKGKDFYRSERRFGSFVRLIELPAGTDRSQIKASYRDGVLEISIPKSEQAKPRQIKVDVK